MIKRTQISKEDFESLLNWFSTDPELAGLKYEEIRKGLERFFRHKGCNDSKELADETINRLAVKLDKLDLTKGYKKYTLFYGFARNVFREHLRDYQKNEVELNLAIHNDDSKPDLEDNNAAELDCLQTCLKKLNEHEMILVTKYFSKEGGEKIILRKKIAEELGITPNALHVRVYRIKLRLRSCVENCLNKNNL